MINRDSVRKYRTCNDITCVIGKSRHKPGPNLFGFMLLGVAWRNKAFRVHLHGIQFWRCLTRRGRQALHLKEGLDIPHFGLVGAVGHGLALGSQNARGFPLGILCLLHQGQRYLECQRFIKPRKDHQTTTNWNYWHCRSGCKPHSCHQLPEAAVWCQISCPSHWRLEPPHNLNIQFKRWRTWCSYSETNHKWPLTS